MPTPPARPPALLLTCIFLGVGSTIVLLELVDALSSWNSVAMQDLVRDTLKEEPLASAGISVEQAMSWLRVLAYVGVVFTAAAAVFSVFTARGDRTSRIMLTILCVLAVLLFAAAGLPGLLFAIPATLSASVLWSPDVRRWFDAVNGKEVAPAAAGATASTIVDATDRPVGERPLGDGGPVAPTQAPVTQTPPAPVVQAASTDDRPRPVRIALGFTIVPSAMALLLGAMTLLFVTYGAEVVRDGFDEPGVMQELMAASDIDADDVIAMLRIYAAVWVAMSLLALVAAAVAARGLRAGRIALIVCSVATIPVSILIGLPFGVATAAAAVTVLVQLMKPEAKAWFTA